MTNRCLTPGRLVLLLEALRELHSSAGDQQTLIKLSEINICANYLPKLKKRYTQHEATYRALSTESEHMFRRVEADLRSYEQERRWQHANVIHGDPVFSNVLLTDDGKIYLLDMRGELGSHLTLQGDLTYDLSKVYQSLLGYDYIILSQPLHERDAELLEELRRTFRTFVREHYPTVPSPTWSSSPPPTTLGLCPSTSTVTTSAPTCRRPPLSSRRLRWSATPTEAGEGRALVLQYFIILYTGLVSGGMWYVG